MIETGAKAGLPMTLSVAHQAVLEQAEAAGLGALDNSALIEVLRGRTAPRDGQEAPAIRVPAGKGRLAS
jgi:hypothetical protein